VLKMTIISTSSSTSTTNHSVIIYYASTSDGDGRMQHTYCSGFDAYGYYHLPFRSTSTTDLKDRLPTTYQNTPIYGPTLIKIADSWTNLWDGTIDSTLFDAELYNDNTSNNFYTGTKSDGTYSGYSCSDWTADGSSNYGTTGSFNVKDSSLWIDNGTETCNQSNLYLCFKFK